MKQLKFIIFIIFFLANFFYLGKAQAAAGWEIEEFVSDIQILEDSSLIVTETVKVNFFAAKHGIFRDIPVKYNDKLGNNLSIKLKVQSVADENGKPLLYSLKRRGRDLRIKIGNPDILVSGKKIYVITYTVKRALNYFNDRDELYWNVTGDGWEVPIKKSSAIVTLPTSDFKQVQTKCFTGSRGSTAKNCSMGEAGNFLQFMANDFLTIAVAWPKGITKKPAWYLTFLWFLADNFGYLLPLIISIFMFYWWYRRGRDPEGHASIMVEYDPPGGLTPAEMGSLVKEKFSSEYLSADLVNLAVKGFIKIREIKKPGILKEKIDYELIKTKEWKGSKLKEHEIKLLQSIFNGRDKRLISELKNKFYKNLEVIKKKIWRQLLKQKYFYENPEKIKIKYRVIGLFIILIGFFLEDIFFHIYIGLLISGIIITIFAGFMPKKSKKGVLAMEHALGFKKYIKVAEQHRIKWEEKENLFFEFLPYAMIFGLADKWARAFEGVYGEPPKWYEGSYTGGFSSAAFTGSLSGFSSSTRQSFVSSPGAAGGGSGFSGGSSGGGFGGGGGGSW